MFEHSFRVVKVGTFEQLVMDFKDEKYEILSIFLESEVSNFGDWIKDTIDKVLSGESNNQKIAGNCCELSTVELRDIINYWCEKVDEFKSGKLNL